jgi:hypothetical protein
MFGKKKTVNQEELRQIMDLLHQAAQTPDYAEQDGPIAEADALFWTTNKKTAYAYQAVSPSALMAIEAVHISSVTGEDVESATNRLDSVLHNGGERAYKVFWYPRPEAVISQLRELGKHLASRECVEGKCHP